MTISKFVLNKINFDNYKMCDPYTSCFMHMTGLTKIHILNHAPKSITTKIETNTTTLTTLIKLCKWKKCNVWILHNNVCHPIGNYPPTHIIDQCTVIPWNNQEYKEYYHTTKPLYALSHYKLDDLKTIAMKLKIPIAKTKKEIYSDIESFIKID